MGRLRIRVPDGVYSRTKNKQTGTDITISHDTSKDISSQWSVTCEQHSSSVPCKTRAHAWYLASKPTNWCSLCKELKKTKQSRLKRNKRKVDKELLLERIEQAHKKDGLSTRAKNFRVAIVSNDGTSKTLYYGSSIGAAINCCIKNGVSQYIQLSNGKNTVWESSSTKVRLNSLDEETDKSYEDTKKILTRALSGLKEDDSRYKDIMELYHNLSETTYLKQSIFRSGVREADLLTSLGKDLEKEKRRFWKWVDKSHLSPGGCWPKKETNYLLPRTKLQQSGYPSYSIGGRGYKAHRLAYIFTYGTIPQGLLVRHRCDNRACVNPDHLVLGTHADNAKDTKDRGRGNRAIFIGEDNKRSVLNEDKVRDILERLSRGETCKSVSLLYGVVPSNIQAIKTRRTWKHVELVMEQLD